jgi:hypothetical protein
MDTTDFNRVVTRRLKKIEDVLAGKAKEYAIGDRLYNFKRAAGILNTTPEKALAGMFVKHLVSVMDLIEGSIESTQAMVDEKVGDAINYLILLEALFAERRVLDAQSKCVECRECSNGEVRCE